MSQRVTRSAWRRIAVAVGLSLVVGALAGVAWELLWTAPRGVALDDRFTFTSSGLGQTFSGTALYVILGFAAGLLLGAGAALRADGAELVTLAALVVGSCAASAVMAAVGIALGPPDADQAARGKADYTPVEQELRIEGVAAYAALPSGALLGAGGVFLSLSRRRAENREDADTRRSGEDPVDPATGRVRPR